MSSLEEIELAIRDNAAGIEAAQTQEELDALYDDQAQLYEMYEALVILLNNSNSEIYEDMTIADNPETVKTVTAMPTGPVINSHIKTNLIGLVALVLIAMGILAIWARTLK